MGCYRWRPLVGTPWRRVEALLFRRIIGVSLARRAGLGLALISGEDSPLVDRYAQKMHIKHVVKGCRDKAAALRKDATSAEIDPSQICFMGDDVNDLPAMPIAGCSAAPANASREVLAQADFIAQKTGRTRRPRIDRRSAGRARVACGRSLQLIPNRPAAL